MSADTTVLEILVKDISVSKLNTREQKFDGEELDGLVASVRARGILQPVLAFGENGHYELADGSRRLAAAKKAGLATIPAIVRDSFSAEDVAEISLTANLQRKDLTALEEARGYKAWLDLTKKTQAELAKRVGKHPSTIANALRILDAPKPLKDALDRGDITPAHVKVGLELRHDSLASSLKLKPGMTVDELQDQVRRENEQYETKGGGARETLRNALADAKAKHPNKTITWKAGPYDVISLGSTLGKPPAQIVGDFEPWHYPKVTVEKHDKVCTCRAYELSARRSFSGQTRLLTELKRVCIDKKGYAAAKPKEKKQPTRAKAAATNKPKPPTPEQLKKIEAKERQRNEAEAKRALTAPTLSPKVRPLLKKLSGSIPVNVARAIVWMERINPEYGMGLPNDAATVAWQRLVAMPANKVSALAAACFANWIGQDWTSSYMHFEEDDVALEVAEYFGVALKATKKKGAKR